MMLQRSTIQLLRIHFSVFLMPVFWLALSQVKNIDAGNTVLCFIILHLFIYPASNGYNSYMDRDTESIGGVSKPLQPTNELFHVTIILDLLALLFSLMISHFFFLGVLLYIAASKAYSYRGIRLKKHPVAGYLTVMIFQGALCYLLVLHACSTVSQIENPSIGMIAAALLIGGFYPLTQVYQHKQDRTDNVTTISMKLGYRGTFIFTAIVYIIAMIFLAMLIIPTHGVTTFLQMQLFFIPVLSFFFIWMIKVYKSTRAADFKNAMRMNIIASLCSNAAFLFLFLKSYFE